MSFFPNHLFCGSYYFNNKIIKTDYISSISDLRQALFNNNTYNINLYIDDVFNEFGTHTLFRLLCEENQSSLFKEHFELKLIKAVDYYQALVSLLIYGDYLYQHNKDWIDIAIYFKNNIKICYNRYSGFRAIYNMLQNPEWTSIIQSCINS